MLKTGIPRPEIPHKGAIIPCFKLVLQQSLLIGYDQIQYYLCVQLTCGVGLCAKLELKGVELFVNVCLGKALSKMSLAALNLAKMAGE